MSAAKNVKRVFLGVLLANEIRTPTLAFKSSLACNISLTSRKAIILRNDHEYYLNQLKQLLSEFGVEVAGIKWGRVYRRLKDGTMMQDCDLKLKNGRINILKLFTRVRFQYAEEKYSKFGRAINVVIKSLQNELENCRLYHQVLRIRMENGWGPDRISTFLGCQEKTNSVGHWLRSKKPRYLNQEQELDNLLKESRGIKCCMIQ